MAQDSYAVDPDDLEGLPPLASPLLASGVDPDQARLALFNGGKGAQPGLPAIPQPGMAGANRSVQMAATLGGAGTPAAVPAPATPAAAPQDGLTGLQRQAFQQGLSAGQQEMDTATQAGEVPPEIAAGQEQLARDQAAAPQPQNYKPSFGQRVVRGLRGALVGGLTGGIPGLLTGAAAPGDIPGGKAYGAPTDAYDLALAQNKRTVAGDTNSLNDALSNWKRQQDAYKARQEATNNAGTIFNNAAKNAVDEQNATTNAARLPIDQQNANANVYKAWAEGPDGKLQLTQGQIDQRTALADRNHMPQGFQRMRYILTGQMQPAHEATADEIALAQATQAFVHEHGYQPQTLAEYQSVVAAAKGGAGGAGGRGSDLRQAMIDLATQAVGRIGDEYKYSPNGAKDTTPYANADPAKEPLSVEQYLDRKNAIAAKLDKDLASKKLPILGLRWKAGPNGQEIPYYVQGAAGASSGSGESGSSGGAGGGNRPQSAPPVSLLSQTPEGGYRVGRHGEVYRKVNGQWAPQ